MAMIEVPFVVNIDEKKLQETIEKTLAENDFVKAPEDNVDDIGLAVISMGIFRKAFCLNVGETENDIEPVFRCSECPFEDKKNKKCLVKMFLIKYANEEDRNRFMNIMW